MKALLFLSLRIKRADIKSLAEEKKIREAEKLKERLKI